MDHYGAPPLNDSEIEEKISEVFSGKFIKVLESEKKSTSETEERLLINGFPVQLEGDEGERIRESLKAGIIPPCDLLNNILLRYGVQNENQGNAFTFQTEYFWKRGQRKLKKNDEMRSSSKEIWKMKETKTFHHDLENMIFTM